MDLTAGPFCHDFGAIMQSIVSSCYGLNPEDHHYRECKWNLVDLHGRLSRLMHILRVSPQVRSSAEGGPRIRSHLAQRVRAQIVFRYRE